MEEKEVIKHEKKLSFRVTLAEQKQIAAAARQARVGVSAYLRSQALGQPLPVVKPPRPDVLSGEDRRILIGVATNLNQAMALSNAGKYATQELMAIIARIKSDLK